MAGNPKIYCFSNVIGGGDGIAYAMAEDGTVLGSHWCTNETYVCNDLSVNEGARPDRHKTYREHYPDGYEMEFIPAANVMKHEGLQKAITLNQEQERETQEEESNAA